MSYRRLKGPEARRVPLLGDRVVQPGEIVEVPDTQADGKAPIVWPDETWEPVPAPSGTAAAVKKGS